MRSPASGYERKKEKRSLTGPAPGVSGEQTDEALVVHLEGHTLVWTDAQLSRQIDEGCREQIHVSWLAEAANEGLASRTGMAYGR